MSPMTTMLGKPLGQWKEITEEDYDEALGSVPPLKMFAGGFLCGEPHSHTRETGETVYSACVQKGRKFYAALVTVKGLDADMASLFRDAI